MLPSLRTVHHDETLILSSAGPLHVAVWLDAPGIEQMERLAELADAQRERYGDRSAFASIVLSGTPRFSGEVREAATALTRRSGTTGAVAAHVVLMSGLAGVAVRSFLSTMLLLARPQVPTRVLGDLDEAAAWMAGVLAKIDPTWTRAGVRSLLEQAVAPAQAPAARSITKIRTPVTET